MLQMLSLVFIYSILLLGLTGCGVGVIAEVAEGITEGIIDQIEEYAEDKKDCQCP